MLSSKLISYPAINLISVLILVSLVGCTPAKYTASSNQNSGIKKVQTHGLELLVSKKEDSIVAVGIERFKRNEEHMKLILIIKNRGNNPFNLSSTSINIIHKEENEYEKLDVYPPDEVVNKITSDEKLIAAINVLTEAYFQNTNSNPYIRENPERSNAFERGFVSVGEALNRSNNAKQTILRNETLSEGEATFGVVYFAIKDDGKLIVTIPTGKESHTFYFKSIEY